MKQRFRKSTTLHKEDWQPSEFDDMIPRGTSLSQVAPISPFQKFLYIPEENGQEFLISQKGALVGSVGS